MDSNGSKRKSFRASKTTERCQIGTEGDHGGFILLAPLRKQIFRSPSSRENRCK